MLVLTPSCLPGAPLSHTTCSQAYFAPNHDEDDDQGDDDEDDEDDDRGDDAVDRPTQVICISGICLLAPKGGLVAIVPYDYPQQRQPL